MDFNNLQKIYTNKDAALRAAEFVISTACNRDEDSVMCMANAQTQKLQKIYIVQEYDVYETIIEGKKFTFNKNDIVFIDKYNENKKPMGEQIPYRICKDGYIRPVQGKLEQKAGFKLVKYNVTEDSVKSFYVEDFTNYNEAKRALWK